MGKFVLPSHLDPGLLKADEVAARMGVDVASLHRAVNRGVYPRRADGSLGWFCTPGGQKRFFPDVVDLHWPLVPKEPDRCDGLLGYHSTPHRDCILR